MVVYGMEQLAVEAEHLELAAERVDLAAVALGGFALAKHVGLWVEFALGFSLSGYFQAQDAAVVGLGVERGGDGCRASILFEGEDVDVELARLVADVE